MRVQQCNDENKIKNDNDMPTENSDIRRVERVKLPSLDDNELGPGIQHVEPSLVRGKEGVFIDDPVVSIDQQKSGANDSNTSFTSAMGTPTVSAKKPSKTKVRTLDFYYNKTGSSVNLNKGTAIARASKSAAQLNSVSDITAHLDEDVSQSSTRVSHLSDEDTSNHTQVFSSSPAPLPKRTPKRGTKRLRNASKNIDNYVETHDAAKAPTFTFDMQKFIQFLPADFQLLSTHKLQPSILQTNNREFIPIPETGVDLFVRARAGLVLQVRSDNRANLLDNYVKQGYVPIWAAHIEPMPGYLHPIAEKIAPLMQQQAAHLMIECATALRGQGRVVGERALYDQEVLERTFQRDKHGYQVAVKRLHDIKDRELQRIHTTVEKIKGNMSYEATREEDVCYYIRGKAQRRYSAPSAPRPYNNRGRGQRARGRGAFSNNRPRGPFGEQRNDYQRNDYQQNTGYNRGRGNQYPRGGYNRPSGPNNSRGGSYTPQPGPSTSGGGYNYDPPQQSNSQYHQTRDRSQDRSAPYPYQDSGNRTNTPSQQNVALNRARSRSPLANVPVIDTIGHYDNNRVGPPVNRPTPNNASSDNHSLTDRDVERIGNAFMSQFRQQQGG